MNREAPAVAKPALAEIAEDVLGNLAYMLTSDAQPFAPGVTPLTATIEYEGPHRGALRCWCSPSFASSLAANLLGVEPDQPEAQTAAIDAVRELLNVLCGHLVTRWYGTHAVFNLSIPTVAPGAAPGGASGDAGRWWHGAVDGEPLILAHTPAE
jgi:hypothetical protein